VAGHRIKLTKLEFGVLRALDDRRGRPVARADLINSAWGTSYAGGSNAVDVVVRGLRRKLAAQASRIETVRNVGYRLK
jgi:DNA-binding response OmpR family regulator